MQPFPRGDIAIGSAGADVEIYDCWNRIGVRGDKSCPELLHHSHCRNCPAYSAASATLLDRDLAGAPAAITHRHKVEAASAKPAQSAVIFRVGSEWFALSTLLVEEIVGVRAIHSLPHRRHPAVLGLTNFRGELVVCLSIARLLIEPRLLIDKLAAATGSARPQSRLIVVRDANGRLAFPVDEVQYTHRYCPEDLGAVPATVAGSASSFTCGLLGWRDKLVGCLDEGLLLAAFARCLA